ncbi:hypothetical protein WDW37_06260 [Bdellovibrionota bacterium FG-1]
MTKFDLEKVAAMDDGILRSYHEIERQVQITLEEVEGLKRSGDLREKYEAIQTTSVRLGQASTVLLNQT